MSNNVFIDEFTTVIPQHRVPIAPDDKVRLALARADAVLASYYDSMTAAPLVDLEWIQDCVVEFGDWLCSRLPQMDESRISRKFRDSVILHDYASFCVQEHFDVCNEHIQNMVLPPGSAMLANGICEAVTLSSAGFHVVVDAPTVAPTYELDFPPCSQEDLDNLQKAELEPGFDIGQLSDLAAYRMLLRQALFVSLLECFSAPYASVAVAITDNVPGDMDADVVVGGFVFFEGRFASLSDRDVKVLLDKLNQVGGGPSGVNLEINAGYESQIADIVNSMARAFSTAMLSSAVTADAPTFDVGAISYPTLVDVSGAEPSELFTDDVETQSIVLGNGMAIVPFELVSDESLPRAFESIHAITLEGATNEACAATTAICAMRSAMMLVEDDNFSRVADMVEEFGDFLELSRGRFDINDVMVAPILDYCFTIESRRNEGLFLEVYDEMETLAKDEVDAIVETMDSKMSYTRKVVALEMIDDEQNPALEEHRNGTWEDQVFGGAPLSAQVMAFPSFASDDEEVLKAVCTRCVCSSKPVTMFFAFEDDEGHLSQLGGIAWENGRWSNIDRSRVEAMLAGSNIGQILNINAPDGFEYYAFKHKETGEPTGA